MRSPGILGGDITNRMATTSFSRPCLTPGRSNIFVIQTIKTMFLILHLDNSKIFSRRKDQSSGTLNKRWKPN